MSVRFVADYPTPEAFLDVVDAEIAHGGMLVRGAKKTGSETACTVEVRVAGQLVAELAADVAAVAQVGVAVMFTAAPTEILPFAQRLRSGAAEKPVEPASEVVANRGT